VAAFKCGGGSQKSRVSAFSTDQLQADRKSIRWKICIWGDRLVGVSRWDGDGGRVYQGEGERHNQPGQSINFTIN
jgi:hypothetical protein